MPADPLDTAPLGATLPLDAGPPYSVFVGGIELVEGDDYDVLGDAIALHVPVEPRRESWWRDLVSTFVGIGFYRQGDFIDVGYRDAHGRTVTATLPVMRLGRPGGDDRRGGAGGLVRVTA